MTFTLEEVLDMVELARKKSVFNEGGQILGAFDDGVNTGLNTVSSLLYEADTRKLKEGQQ